MKRLFLTAIAAAIIAQSSAAAQTTVTVSGTSQGQTQNLSITVLPKSTISLGFAAGTPAGVPGQAVNFDLTMSTTRLQPASVQFTLTAPSTLVSIFNVTPGATATAAGKTFTCAVPTTPPPPAGTTQFNCIGAGINTSTIGNGIVAHVAVTLATSAPPGSATVTLSNFSSASAFGGAPTSALSTATGTITITPTFALNCAPDTNSVPGALANQVESGPAAEQLACTVTFSAPVAAATPITLVSSNTASPGVTVTPAAVTVPAGGTTASFTITGQ